MFAWSERHPIVTWGLAWCVCFVGLTLTYSPSVHLPSGLRWLGFLPSMLSWGIAGSATFARERRQDLYIWWGAFVTAVALGSIGYNWLDQGMPSDVATLGFVGALLGWGAGAGLGAAVSTYSRGATRALVRSIIFGSAFGFLFAVGGFLAIMLGDTAWMFLFGKLGLSGTLVGACIGVCLAGMLAAALGLSIQRVVFKPWKPVAV